MKNNKVDELLKNALSSMETPDDTLNQQIRKCAKEIEMNKKRRYRKWMTVAAAAVVFLGVSTTALAAYKVLSASAVAQKLEQPELADSFEINNSLENEVNKQDKKYEVTLLGLLLGEKLSDELAENLDLTDGRTYAAVAIKRTDGAPMQETDGTAFMATPLIEGLNPAEYNIASMNGGYTRKIMDGVLYYIVDCDDITCFADRKIYLAVLDSTFYNQQAYRYDEATGTISRQTDYDGMNLLFDLPVDSGLADQSKAETYLEELRRQWEEQGEEPELPEVEEIVKHASLIEDSVKEITKNEKGEYYYEYLFGYVDGMEDKTTYSSSMDPFLENEKGYLLISMMGGDGEGTKYIVFHKDDNGKITGMIYVDQ